MRKKSTTTDLARELIRWAVHVLLAAFGLFAGVIFIGELAMLWHRPGCAIMVVVGMTLDLWFVSRMLEHAYEAAA